LDLIGRACILCIASLRRFRPLLLLDARPELFDDVSSLLVISLVLELSSQSKLVVQQIAKLRDLRGELATVLAPLADPTVLKKKKKIMQL